MVHGQSVSIAALLASGVAPRPHEAVAIVLELCGQVATRPAAAGVMPAISASTVTLGHGGTVSVAGGLPGEDEQTVFLVGRLLLEMLDHPADGQAAVPPRLRATALRAASGGRAAFPTLAELASALRRHGPDYEPSQAVADVVGRWEDRGARNPGAEAVRADSPHAGPERRKNSPAPDVLRRFLREAEQEAYRARMDAGTPSQARPADPAPAPAQRTRRFWMRATRALLVGALLLALAGAGVMLLAAGSIDTPPLVLPVSKPAPTAPRAEPGWELLRRPERVSLEPPPRNARPKAGVPAGSSGRREAAAPAPAEPPTGR